MHVCNHDCPAHMCTICDPVSKTQTTALCQDGCRPQHSLSSFPILAMFKPIAHINDTCSAPTVLRMLFAKACVAIHAGVYGDDSRGSGGVRGAEPVGSPHAARGYKCAPAAMAGSAGLLVSPHQPASCLSLLNNTSTISKTSTTTTTTTEEVLVLPKI